MVRLILNILWLVLGGIWSAIAWFFVGILCRDHHHWPAVGALVFHAGQLHPVAVRA
jgi:hypothetical protein